MSHAQLAVQFFFQVAIILAACVFVGRICKMVGQPQVVAEMVAGILLGPSLVGFFFPEFLAKVFPPASMGVLSTVSQLGLATYMFVIGLEFRIDIVQKHFRSAMAVSVVGMVVPFVLGALLAWYLHTSTDLFPKGTTLVAAMLFIGASMCITAFPMLARIIQFKNLSGTTIGTVSLGAGAINDAAAWCLLALVLATIDGDFTTAFVNIGGGIVFVAIMFLLVRPLLVRWGRGIELRGKVSDQEFTFSIILLALGAWITDLLGLHAVLGAFVVGMCIPRGLIATTLIDRIQPFTVALLLPLFFTFSGLNTSIGTINSVWLWFIAGLVLFTAIAGKGIACWLAARATGIPQHEALGIGILMNTRGLMELIILNIGLSRGIISPALFATLVVMAVVTTLMTSPLFEWLSARRANLGAEPASQPS